MLTEQIPDDALIDWARSYTKSTMDRPWFHTKPPVVAIDVFDSKCRCNTLVKLVRYECEDDAGWVYLGQCKTCETIIWSYKSK